jgi:putative flippase GtrA
LSQFLTVGASNAAIDLAVFNLLDALHRTTSSVTLVIYNTVAVEAGGGEPGPSRWSVGRG